MRVYHPYYVWEDYKNGMWRKETPDNEKDLLDKAIDFTGDPLLYGSYMQKVIIDWPVTCQHNLTDETQNRKAWIGHAAACMGIKCPEYITRMAWGFLTKKQQDEANNQADIAIDMWERKNGYNRSYYAKELFDN